ncbi:MAG: hypothetical protein WC052_05165 [Patescibacteria group bacterium]
MGLPRSTKNKLKIPLEDKPLTPKEEKAAYYFAKQAEQPGAPSVGKALRMAGINKWQANTPKLTTDKKAWKEAVTHHLNDGYLAETHSKIVFSSEIVNHDFPESADDDAIEASVTAIGGQMVALGTVMLGPFLLVKRASFIIGNDRVRLDALDKAYKIRGLYAPERIEQVIDDIRSASDEELSAEIEETKKMLRSDYLLAASRAAKKKK